MGASKGRRRHSSGLHVGRGDRALLGCSKDVFGRCLVGKLFAGGVVVMGDSGCVLRVGVVVNVIEVLIGWIYIGVSDDDFGRSHFIPTDNFMSSHAC